MLNHGIGFSLERLRLRPAAFWAAGAASAGLFVDWLLRVESFSPLDENSGKALLGLTFLAAGLFGWAVLIAIGEWALRQRIRSPWAPLAWGALLTLLTIGWFPPGAMLGSLYVGTLLADRLGATRRVPWPVVWPLWLAGSLGITFAILRFFV